MVIDYFLFFNEKELLELRINLLKDHVDKFVICEANKTHSGNSKSFQLSNLIDELNLPKEKIQVIELLIPDANEIVVEEHDRLAMFPGDKDDIESILALSRERLQRNALMAILDNFQDDDFFIISDIDEIINPQYIEYAVMISKFNPNVVYKFPLMNLYGEADLRPYYLDGSPFIWRTALSVIKKTHLLKTTPQNLRAQYNLPFRIENPRINGAIFDDFGWHFSWMGGPRKILEKSLSYSHAPNKGHIESRNKGFVFVEGQSVVWDKNTILKRIPHDMLPKQIFKLPNVLKYLLPNYEK